jgi:hypothetical protein
LFLTTSFGVVILNEDVLETQSGQAAWAPRKFCRPAREKSSYHENTNGRKHEIEHENLRIFMIL